MTINKVSKFTTRLALTAIMLLATAQSTFAQAVPTIVLTPPSAGFSDFGSLISTGLTIIFIVAGLAVLVYLFIGAFTYLTAGDNEENTKKARSMITNAVIGLIILAAAWALWLLVINLVPGLAELLGQ